MFRCLVTRVPLSSVPLCVINPFLKEELFTGVSKKFNINRRIRDGATGGYVQVTKTIECPIKPGYKAGTKLTFPDDGDEQLDGSALISIPFFCLPCPVCLHDP